MSVPAIAAMVIAATVASDIPRGHADFGVMSDREIADWLDNAHFFHAANVYRCQGLRYREAESELSQELARHRYDSRRTAVGLELARRYGAEDRIVLPVGHRITRRYCRSIRFVVTDLVKGMSELERRLGIRN